LQFASQWFDHVASHIDSPNGTDSSVMVRTHDIRSAQFEAQKQCPNRTVGATQLIDNRNY
jgi:hypothetical protein